MNWIWIFKNCEVKLLEKLMAYDNIVKIGLLIFSYLNSFCGINYNYQIYTHFVHAHHIKWKNHINHLTFMYKYFQTDLIIIKKDAMAIKSYPDGNCWILGNVSRKGFVSLTRILDACLSSLLTVSLKLCNLQKTIICWTVKCS